MVFKQLPSELQELITRSYIEATKNAPNPDPLIALFDTPDVDSNILYRVMNDPLVRMKFLCRCIELGAVRLVREMLTFFPNTHGSMINIALEGFFHHGHGRHQDILAVIVAHYTREQGGAMWEDVMRYPHILGMITCGYVSGFHRLVTLLRVPRFRRGLSQKVLDDALYIVCTCHLNMSYPRDVRSTRPSPEILRECYDLLVVCGANHRVFIEEALKYKLCG